MEKFDVVIIGSGLGGLQCGYILSQEGYKVLILEKNKQIGGNLQTFARDKCIFDTGIHYIGGLSEGQNLNTYFKYFGLMDKLKLKKLNEDAYDIISFDGDDNLYPHAQGYDNFKEQLLKFFPAEKKALDLYCAKLQEICQHFPLYNVEDGDKVVTETSLVDTSAKVFIESITDNVKLQKVLAGSNVLYAGDGSKTPLYVHALVVNSYIESAYRCIDGGSQIARILTASIIKNGGKILKHTEAKKIVVESDVVKYVEDVNGERYEGKFFISNIHPVPTLEMIDSDLIRKAYRERINTLENTISTFMVNVVLKKDSGIPYFNSNYYHYRDENIWDMVNYKEENWPPCYCIFTSAHSKPHDYAESLSLMTYMHFHEMKKWEKTYNTVGYEDYRGAEYEEFKNTKAELLMEEVKKRIPALEGNIYSYYTSTPLSYRDYIGTKDGSLYGILKDYTNPLKTFISPKTKISNLFLTGQNLNLHGVLGVTVGAVKTCSQLLGSSYLIDKIKKAQ
jgi:all-trans-retinol 13,14-reductase